MGDTTAEHQLDPDKSKPSYLFDKSDKDDLVNSQKLDLPPIASDTAREPEKPAKRLELPRNPLNPLHFRRLAEPKNTQQLSSRSLMIRHRASIDYSNQMSEAFKSGVRGRADSIQSYQPLKKSFTKEMGDSDLKSQMSATKRNLPLKASVFSFSHLKQQTEPQSQRNNGTVRSTTPKAEKSPELHSSSMYNTKTPSKRRIYIPASRGSESQIAQARENSVRRC